MKKTAYDNIKSNNRKTALLVIAFPIIFVALIFLFVFLALLWTSNPGVNVLPQTLDVTAKVAIPTFIACIAWLGISWAFGDSMLLSSAGAHEIHPDEAKYKQVFRSVENVALAAGLPTPRVYIIDDSGMNAFATGRSPKDASIALTRGIIEKLKRPELEGVIAHEMAHIGNRDIRLDMLLITGVGVTVFAADMIARMMFYAPMSGGGGDSKDNKNGAAVILMAVLLAFLVFNWLISPILRMAVSRKREYAADATGAFIARNPQALADALREISTNSSVRSLNDHKTMAIMCIEDPRLKRSLNGGIKSLYATHPPVEARIKRLEEM